ncbi:MAG: cytochrome C [Desulfuromonadales bacterium]|nr:cytochrome C [Desulfuromonadales bacterium]
MVSAVLIIALLLVSLPAWGEQPRQMCQVCHPVHYAERGGCPDCHRGNPSSDRKNIAHAGLIPGKYTYFALGDQPHVKNGNRLIDQYACRRCHVIDGRGNRLAVSLDVAAAGKTPVELAGSIRRPAEFMPDFGMDEARITYLLNALLAGSHRHTTDGGGPVAVHFDTARKKSDVFSIKCGSCHRLLSEKRGALGKGNIGPNLSGLLSNYYPKTFRNSEAWTVRRLKSWLDNPRTIKTGARMRPVILTGQEFSELVDILKVEHAEEI